MLKTLKLAALLSLLALSSAGCSALSFLQPTATPTATSTSTPTLTPTFTPTNTPRPTNTKRPECHIEDVFWKMKLSVDYDEFQVFYHTMDGVSTLVLWFKDPDLDPNPNTDDALYTNLGTAGIDALIASQKLNAVDKCVGRLFDEINVLVNDSENNHWISTIISTSDLPDKVSTDDRAILTLLGKMDIAYRGIKPADKIGKTPQGRCTWEEFREKILTHFPPDQENMAFFLIRGDFGTNVWAQWVTSQEYLEPNLLASLMNISMELNCLHPEPDRLFFTIVDGKGNILVNGFWDGEAMKAQDLGEVMVEIK
jgi:hypothetical protein